MRFSFLFFLAGALISSAQIISFGVKAGVPLTEPTPSYSGFGSQLDTGRWTVGPTIEVRLGHGLSFEADALYRGYRSFNSYFFSGASYPTLYSWTRTETKAWDFPFLIKYRFTAGRWRPFVDGGYSFTRETADSNSFLQCVGTSEVCNLQGVYNSVGRFVGASHSQHHGNGVVGVGVDFKLRKITIAPEIRYSRSNTPNRNQATILVGFTF